MKEFDVIRQFFLPLSNNHDFCQNFANDVAKIELASDEQLVVSKDIFAENSHFYLADGGFNIASKLLLTNLSDIAASGAMPLCYMLGFTKNQRIDQHFLKDFSNGLRSVQDQYGIFLLGGDTISSKKELFFSITIFGIAKKGEFSKTRSKSRFDEPDIQDCRASEARCIGHRLKQGSADNSENMADKVRDFERVLRRDAAKDGDLIFVSGTIGDAGLGLKIVKSKSAFTKKNNQLGLIVAELDEISQKFLIERHYLPTPRIALGLHLLENGLSSCAIDVSDGLLSDLRHLCVASNLSAKIFLDKIPFSKAAENFLRLKTRFNKLNLLSSGDDYELIFSAKSSQKAAINELAKALGLRISEIGFFEKTADEPRIKLFKSSLEQNSQEIKIKKFGYEH